MVQTQRILLLITDLELGGTPTVVRELAVRLRRSSPCVDVQVACLSKWGPVATQLADAGVTVTPLKASGPRDLHVLPRLIHLIRKERFDTVFSFLIHANTLAAVASLFVRNVRWIQSMQTTQPWPAWHWWMQHLVHHAANLVVVPSPSVAQCAGAWSHISADKLVVIPNAIDPGEFANCQSSIPAVNPRPYPITFLGRLDPIKDVPTLIHAISRLGQLAHLHIYGDGSDRNHIEREIAAQDLNHRITLHGVIARPQEALAASGLLVLPSLAEGFGLVLIEAMAAGVPVIATNVAGIRDVIVHEQTGLLVPPSNSAALAAAIRRMIEDRELRQRLIANAAQDVRQRFTWDIVLDQYRRVLEV